MTQRKGIKPVIFFLSYHSKEMIETGTSCEAYPAFTMQHNISFASAISFFSSVRRSKPENSPSMVK